MMRALVLTLAVLAAVSCNQPTPQRAPPMEGFQRPDLWTAIAPGVSSAAGDTDLVTITTTAEHVGYQVEHNVSTQGKTRLILRYDVTLTGGPVYFGALADDRSRWHRNIIIPADSRSAGEERIDVSGDVVHLVFQTDASSAHPTTIVVHDIQYRFE